MIWAVLLYIYDLSNDKERRMYLDIILLLLWSWYGLRSSILNSTSSKYNLVICDSWAIYLISIDKMASNFRLR